MKIKKSFIIDGDRYQLDFDACSSRKGFAQIDSRHDAWYFGQWINPERLRYVSYCEGDITVLDFENAAEMRAFFRDNIATREDFIGIDTLCNDALTRATCSAGLGQYLH